MTAAQQKNQTLRIADVAVAKIRLEINSHGTATVKLESCASLNVFDSASVNWFNRNFSVLSLLIRATIATLGQEECYFSSTLSIPKRSMDTTRRDRQRE